jgi:hypothetical protein
MVEGRLNELTYSTDLWNVILVRKADDPKDGFWYECTDGYYEGVYADEELAKADARKHNVTRHMGAYPMFAEFD